ncbi:carbohydrate ABC transporter permease [Micromonospora yangpuensis]|uniref:Carbohydrate ABC transporter membrane protein 2, CUT1 family n=1 Tax=Micromonospora yangpuensis TaxID=683228 RepID=A0A1C6UUR7_9ACTN|nr:carbohydrate ABC transporter permease [Micromonospora yangpuensis]GGM23904.1 transporter [Micromonospora yangpuensis]SCL57760.1 carbohydrate ABC transporter membrane protein 2, CUT1 family [Micromonospora yangpuensis]
MDRDRIETVSLRWLRRLVIAGFLLITVLPFWYMLVLSVRPIERLLLAPGTLLVPLRELTFDTYTEVLRSVADGGQGFLTFMGNSAVVALAATALTLLVAIPGAYAVSRLRFFGRRQIDVLFLAVYLFPSIVIAIPLFVVFTRAGLRGSLLGLVLVYISQTLPVSVYMLKNYFETIPVSLEESAAIDGASRLGIIRRVSLPLAAPSIMAVALYDFMIAWNEYLFALLFLVDRPDRWTVSLGLSLLSDGVEVPKTVLMAGSVVLTLPIVILFFASERLLTEGLTSGAEKG